MTHLPDGQYHFRPGAFPNKVDFHGKSSGVDLYWMGRAGKIPSHLCEREHAKAQDACGCLSAESWTTLMRVGLLRPNTSIKSLTTHDISNMSTHSVFGAPLCPSTYIMEVLMKCMIFLGILTGFIWVNPAVAAMTPLCQQVYGEEHYGDSTIYGAQVVLGETYAIAASTGISELQKEQIIALGRVNELYNDDEASQDEKVTTVLKNTDDKNAIYQAIYVATTGTAYEQYRIYLGDTEVSALFLKGTLFMVARTSDAECYQDETTDEIETVNEQISLARKQWIDLGPFENKTSLKVSINELNSRLNVSLYVRKGKAPSFSNYDCRKKSKHDEDMSCNVTGEGTYYVAVYRYAEGGGEPIARARVSVSYPLEKETIVKPISSSGILAKGKKHYLGPFPASSSFKAVLHGLGSGVYTNIYVKKGSQAEYWKFDCRKSSRTDDDLSCTFDEPGDYYIQVYRSRTSGGSEFELYAVDITIDPVEQEKPQMMVKRDQISLFMNQGD